MLPWPNWLQANYVGPCWSRGQFEKLCMMSAQLVHLLVYGCSLFLRLFLNSLFTLFVIICSQGNNFFFNSPEKILCHTCKLYIQVIQSIMKLVIKARISISDFVAIFIIPQEYSVLFFYYFFPSKLFISNRTITFSYIFEFYLISMKNPICSSALIFQESFSIILYKFPCKYEFL